MVKRFFLLGLALASLAFSASTTTKAQSPQRTVGTSAVVFMYHRFGEGAHPSTNTRLDQLDTHIRELTSGDYTVLPLEQIVAAIRSGKPLPDKAVGISIDDAYLSVNKEAWPKLKAAGLPFTLFVSTGPVGKGYKSMMTWDDIRDMAVSGVTIGNHAIRHGHMAAGDVDAMRAEILAAQERFELELGYRPTLFAYPFGETNEALMKAVEELGFTAAFGQHSGVIDASDHPFYLPRFALNEKYGELSRVRMAARALPLPAKEVLPIDPMIPADQNPPAFGFTVPASVTGLNRLACFASHQGKLELDHLGVPGGETRIEARMEKPLPKGRTRINCTLPGPDNRWRWFGRQLYVK